MFENNVYMSRKSQYLKKITFWECASYFKKGHAHGESSSVGLDVRLESESCLFKPHLVLCLVYQPILNIRLLVTSESNSTTKRLILEEWRCRIIAILFGIIEYLLFCRRKDLQSYQFSCILLIQRCKKCN